MGALRFCVYTFIQPCSLSKYSAHNVVSQKCKVLFRRLHMQSLNTLIPSLVPSLHCQLFLHVGKKSVGLFFQHAKKKKAGSGDWERGYSFLLPLPLPQRWPTQQGSSLGSRALGKLVVKCDIITSVATHSLGADPLAHVGGVDPGQSEGVIRVHSVVADVSIHL